MCKAAGFCRIFLLTALGAFGGAACARTPERVSQPELFLSSYLVMEASPAFQRALTAEAGTPKLEKIRIEYLLERISNSPYNFLRNDSRYTGKRAAAHLRWKLFWAGGRVQTAEQFIRGIATRSKKSGQFYQVELPEGMHYPLFHFLWSELKLFDEEVEKQRKLLTSEQKLSSL